MRVRVSAFVEEREERDEIFWNLDKKNDDQSMSKLKLTQIRRIAAPSLFLRLQCVEFGI